MLFFEFTSSQNGSAGVHYDGLTLARSSLDGIDGIVEPTGS